jgi:hypothetical protein
MLKAEETSYFEPSEKKGVESDNFPSSPKQVLMSSFAAAKMSG